MPKRSMFGALAAAMLLALSVTSSTLGAAPHRTVQILDNCDGPSFNAVIGEGACERGSGLSFDKFAASLATGGAKSWRFSPARVKLAAGGSVSATNRGGETHTFSRVAAFAGGCVPDIFGPMGLAPNPGAECATIPATLVPPGTTVNRGPLPAGTNFFQCLIHPWQRTTVVVG